jgi:tRNA(adenine34) deaminase
MVMALARAGGLLADGPGHGKIHNSSPALGRDRERGLDEAFMRAALELAVEARRQGEVPVGAVVVLGGAIVGRGYNQPIRAHDPTAHAEIMAMRDAAAGIGNYRLTGAELYVTIEPCQMCVGAMVHARIARVVYAAREPKAGAIESAMRAHEHPSLNHRMQALGGVLEADSRELIQEFFRERRDAGDRSQEINGEVPKWS